MDIRIIRHFHLFAGLGGGARGFNRASVRVGQMQGVFRCIGGVDVDPAAMADFQAMTGVPGTVLDLFDRDQYRAFHGSEPPRDWREATPDDICRAAGGENPHIVFLSAPCKGFSGLLAESRSTSERYQALNRLTVRGVFLMLEAFKDDLPELVIFENVPRIMQRGRKLLDIITGLLRAYGYVTAETTHDCGEIGGLAQSRKRFLMVARHAAKVPPFLYEPPKRRLRAVGEVLDLMPLPGDESAGGPMHRVPSLQWRTWVRLAFVEAGSDWRSLQRLRVRDGVLADYRLVPQRTPFKGSFGVLGWEESMGAVAGESLPVNGKFSVADPRVEGYHNSTYGVVPWGEATGTVTGNSRTNTGRFAVADPRCREGTGDYRQLGVRAWDQPTGTVTSQRSPGQGSFSVADPRHQGPAKHSNEFRVVRFDEAGRAVTSAHGSGQCVADPRPAEGRFQSKYRVTRFDEAGGTVIAASGTGDGAFAVADPRTGWAPEAHQNKLAVGAYDDPAKTVIGTNRGPGSGALCVADPRWVDGERDAYQSGGHYGVLRWEDTSGAVSSAGQHDNGRWSVADPRLPEPDDRLVALIVAEDGTWHRPFTTLELAALQSLVDPEEKLELDGLSDAAWRERIGNAVPPDAARAIAETMGRTLLLAWSGEGFFLSDVPIWVRDVAVALSVQQQTP